MRIAFLHGFAGTPDAWADIAIDGERIALPGHGGPPIAQSWDACLASMTVDADLVVGYSLGARVALGLVAAGRVPRAILISVNPGLDDSAREPRRVVDAAWAAMLRERGLEVFLAAWEAQPLFATQARVDEARRLARRARRLTLDAEQLARSLEVMGLAEMPDYRHALAIRRAAIDDRVALIAGADDPKYVAIAESYPVRREIIAGSGHDPTLEQPAALTAAIRRLT